MKNIIASGLVLLLLVGGLAQSWVRAADTSTVGAEKPDFGPEAEMHKAPANNGIIDLYFIGKRRSQIEPCGCQTKQRGGVEYEASLFDQHPGRPKLMVDAGEFTRGMIDMAPIEALKTRFLLRAMSKLGYDAVNVSVDDLQFEPAFYQNLTKEHPEATANLISSNVYEAATPDKRVFPAYRIVERKLADGSTLKVGIIGVTSVNWTLREKKSELKTGSYLVKDPIASVKPVVKELRPKVDLLLVLYSAMNNDEVQILSNGTPGIDAVVTTAYLPDPTALVMRDGNGYLFHTPNLMGKEVGVVSLRKRANQGWEPAAMPTALYVALDLPVDKDQKDLIEEFKAATQKLEVKVPSAYDVKQIYAGSQSCVACHRPVYDSWAKTKHAHALEALVNVGQQFNPDCVKCHVTGYMHENGFYTVTDRPSLTKANVQCEVCHGPAQRHVTLEQQIAAGVKNWKTPAEYQEILKQAKEAVPKKEVAAATCIQCHQGENDPHFVYEDYIHKVDHSDVDEADKKPSMGRTALLSQ